MSAASANDFVSGRSAPRSGRRWTKWPSAPPLSGLLVFEAQSSKLKARSGGDDDDASQAFTVRVDVFAHRSSRVQSGPLPSRHYSATTTIHAHAHVHAHVHAHAPDLASKPGKHHCNASFSCLSLRALSNRPLLNAPHEPIRARTATHSTSLRDNKIYIIQSAPWLYREHFLRSVTRSCRLCTRPKVRDCHAHRPEKMDANSTGQLTSLSNGDDWVRPS